MYVIAIALDIHFFFFFFGVKEVSHQVRLPGYSFHCGIVLLCNCSEHLTELLLQSIFSLQLKRC